MKHTYSQSNQPINCLDIIPIYPHDRYTPSLNSANPIIYDQSTDFLIHLSPSRTKIFHTTLVTITNMTIMPHSYHYMNLQELSINHLICELYLHYNSRAIPIIQRYYTLIIFPTLCFILTCFISNIIILYHIDPNIYVKASKFECWNQVIQVEFNTFEKMRTWSLVNFSSVLVKKYMCVCSPIKAGRLRGIKITHDGEKPCTKAFYGGFRSPTHVR